LLSGCGVETFRRYSGTKLSIREVGILKFHNAWGTPLQIVEIDGKAVDYNNFSTIEFLPGKHYVTVLCSSGIRSGGTMALSFTVKAGHKYVVKYKEKRNIFTGKGTWKAWIVDVADSGDTILNFR